MTDKKDLPIIKEKAVAEGDNAGTSTQPAISPPEISNESVYPSGDRTIYRTKPTAFPDIKDRNKLTQRSEESLLKEAEDKQINEIVKATTSPPSEVFEKEFDATNKYVFTKSERAH